MVNALVFLVRMEVVSRLQKISCVFLILMYSISGKTTLISALSGHVTPKRGGALYLAGENIVLNADIIHSMVGVCPQQDIVWNELNVMQHLSFQAKQRGVPSHKMSAEVQRVAVLVNLDGDAFFTPASKLSGGMKRRLSIGMSIIGDP